MGLVDLQLRGLPDNLTYTGFRASSLLPATIRRGRFFVTTIRFSMDGARISLKNSP